MRRKHYIGVISLIVIVASLVWFTMARKAEPEHASADAAREPAPAEERRTAAQPLESSPLTEPKSAAPSVEPSPRIPAPKGVDVTAPASPPVRRSDLELQSRPLADVQLRSPRDAAEVPLLPGFVGPTGWRNLGGATASAAFETHCWAIDQRDVDVLLSTVDLSDASRAKLKTVFDQLPAEDRAKYGSPERMLGMIWVYHGLPFSGFMIESEVARSPAEAGVLLQLQYGQRGASREFVFKRAPDGWRKITPDQQVDNFLRMTGISPDVLP